MTDSNRIYKRPINIPNTGHELVTCHFPLRLDTYSGCSHNCSYCYAKNLLEKRGYWKNIRMADSKYIENLLDKYIDRGVQGKIGDSIRNKVPFRLGGLTDCFQEKEKESKVTEETIDILNRYNYPYLIVTKSPIINEYIDLLDSDLALIQVTITTANKELANKIEPNAPSPHKRLETLGKLNDNGYSAIARFSPVIPEVNLSEVKELMELYSSKGAKHVLVEFFRGNKGMLENIREVTGLDLSTTLWKDGYYYRFPLEQKVEAYRRMKEIANSWGMTFSICSDGDPVPFHLNDTENCCGADYLKNFEGVKRVAPTLFKHLKRKREVGIKDMEKYWTPAPEVFEKSWFNGEFEKFIYGARWDGRDYSLDNSYLQ